jgi:hypothetical protein
VIKNKPGAVLAPLPKAVENRLPAWEGLLKQPPATSALDHIKDGLEQRSNQRGWSAHALPKRKECFDQSPIFLREDGVEGRMVQRPYNVSRGSPKFLARRAPRSIQSNSQLCYVGYDHAANY